MPPAAKHFDPILGIDVHIIQPPPPAPPVPIPHPHTGMLMDPCDYAPYIGGTVKVGGLQRAQAGTAGISIPKHIPIGGTFVKPPENESEMFMGSSTVACDGDAFSYLGLPVLTCQCIGMPPIPRAKGSTPKSLVLPTTVCLSVPMPVMVGGGPTVSLMALGMRAGMAALGAIAGKAKKAWKGRKAKGKGPKKGVNGKKCDGAHPVDIISGANFDTFVDAKAPPPRLFNWSRHYTTARVKERGPLGYAFRHSYQHTLTLHHQAWVYEAPDGKQAAFDPLPPGKREAVAHGYRLTKLDRGRFEVRHRDEPCLTFEQTGDEKRLRLVSIQAGPKRWLTLDHDPQGRLAKIAEHGPEGRVEYLLRYDRRDRIAELVKRADGAERRLVAYRYDDADDLVASLNAEGGRFKYEYDGGHRWLNYTDPRGYVFSWIYDDLGRCVEATGQDGLWWAKFDYDPDNFETRVTERNGGVYIYRYDDVGTLRELEDPYGGVLERVVDPNDGSVLVEIDAGGRWVNWDYDEFGAHTGRTDRFLNSFGTEDEQPMLPDTHPVVWPRKPSEWMWGRDVDGAPAAATTTDVPKPARALAGWALQPAPVPAQSATAQLEYDELARVTSSRDAAGRETRYRYDAAGNLVERVDRDGRVHRQVTTSWNLTGSEIDPLGNRTNFEYTSNEQLRKLVDPNGNETEYDYDEKDRVVAIRRDGTVRDQYVYDTGDCLIEKLDRDGNQLLSIDYDSRCLMKERRLATGEVHRFAWDALGQLRSASTDAHEVHLESNERGAPVSDEIDGVGVEHAYVMDRLRRTTFANRFTTRYVTDPVTGVTTLVDPTGAHHRLEEQDNGVFRRDHSSGTCEMQRFDGDGRCIGVARWRSYDDGASTTHAIRYRYSNEGDLLEVQDSVAGRTEFEFDAAHRLVGEHGPHGHHSFSLDRAGNVLSKPGLHRVKVGPGNKIEEADGEVFDYDNRNHIRRRTGLGGSGIRYEYDALDRLVAVHDDRWDEPWQATYDAIGRRLSSGRGDHITRYYWDADRLAAEVAPNGELRIYVYANESSRVPLLFVDYDAVDAPPESGRVHAVFSNQVGVPTRIENAQGRVVWQAYRIDPYGQLDVDAGATLEYNLRWPGHYFDADTGLHYNRHRYYDPGLGRYLQSDPIGHAGGINVYAYAPNPLSSVDLLGLAHDGATSPNANSADGVSPNKEPVKVGDVDSYKNLKKREVSGDGLEHDHIPSSAAIQAKADKDKFEATGEHLTDTERGRIHRKATCLEVDKDTHKAGRTHGRGKNTPKQIDGDSKDLKAAAQKDIDAHKPNLKEQGYSDEQIKDWEDSIHNQNQERGIYDDPLQPHIWEDP